MAYRPELDGLRSIAVYLVLLFHAGMITFGGGFIGVDLFFVLSGFLVTAVILHEVDQRGTFDLGAFYARRVRRLLPAALVVIVVVALFQSLVASLPARLDMVDDARASLLYFANWHFILEARDYFAADTGGSPFLHFWSLAIEEQFYIAFPLLALLAIHLSRRPVRFLAIALIGVAVLSIALQVWRASSDPTYAYYATETRVYQLAIGAFLTLVVRAMARRGRGSAMGGLATLLAVVGLGALVLTASRWVDVSASTRGLLATAASAALIFGVWWSREGWLSRLLALPAPRYLGKISYGTYLWHWPVLLVVQQVFDVRPLVTALLGAAIATGLAALSFTLFEHPLRRAPALAPRRWSMVAGGLTASVLAAVLIVPGALEAERRPALAASGAKAGSLATALDRPVPADLDLVAAKNDVGPSTQMCTTDDTEACMLTEGTKGHLLLLGDSQARMYIPALERIAHEQSLTFSVNVVAGCPWQLGQVNLRDGNDDRIACREAREDFVREVLPRMEVDVVLAVGLSRSELYWEERLGGTAGADESLDALQVRTTRESAAAITAAGPELVIAHSLFGTNGFALKGFDPIECLATAQLLADCAVTPPAKLPAVDGAYAVLEAEMPSVHTVDFNPVICPGHPICAPVLGRTVVWRDSNHVTTTALLEQQPRIWQTLRATGAFE